MKRLQKIGLGALFMLPLIALLAFLRLFTQSETPFNNVVWESAFVLDANGEQRSFDPNDRASFPTPEQGGLYSFTATLSAVPEEAILMFNFGGAEITLYQRGTEIFRAAAPVGAASAWGWTQALVPLNPDAEGAKLTATLRLLPGEKADILPPFLRVTTNGLSTAETIANANLYALPAGASALALMLVCGVFMLGLYEKKPDWKLPALVAALTALMLIWLQRNGGLYFLPRSVSDALAGDAALLLPSFSILLYMALCRDRASWRRLGVVSAVSAAALTAAYLVSLAAGWELSSYVNQMVVWLFKFGDWRTPVHWLTVYLVFASTLLAAYGHISAVTATRTQTQVLALKNELAMESCRAMEQNSRRTAELRHELKNQVAAMNALFAKGDMQGLSEYLKELDRLQGNLTPARYTGHFLINSILQNAAERAAQSDTRFEARVNVPENVGIEERDLSAFFMNMLDNALEAACRVESGARFISVSAELKNGFLAISCKNSYSTPVKTDGRGGFATTKADAAAHGFGMRQMRAVAEKYHSILDVSCTDDVFTAQTALKTQGNQQK